MYETLESITMSQEVAFTGDDYSHIFKWFELVFADGKRKPTGPERNTFIKISAMAMGYAEELAREEEDEDLDD